MFRPSARANHLSDYWNALNRGAPDDELARLAAHVEPSHLAAIRQAREADHPPLPDPAFARRLERILMNAAAHPSAEAIPLPRIRGQAGTPGRPASRRPFGLPRPDIGRYAIPALEITLIVALILASIVGIWLTTGRNDEPNVIVPPVATPTTEATPDVPMYRGNSARTGVFPGPGIDGTPEILWQVPTGDQVIGVPALVDGVLYLGAARSGVVAFNAANGEQLWSHAVAPSTSSPAVTGGLIYATTDNGLFLALDAATGEERWSFPNIRGRSNPVVVDGVVFIEGNNGGMYALNAKDGSEIWSVELPAYASRSVAVADDVVYVPIANGMIRALDAATGAEVWTWDSGVPAAVNTPAVAGGIVYAGANEPMSPSAGGWAVALDAATGELIWRIDDDPGFGFGLPTPSGALLYILKSDEVLLALDPRTGEQQWVWEPESDIWAAPAVVGDELYAATTGGVLASLDAATGTEHWAMQLDALIQSGPIVAGGVAYVGTYGGSLYAISDSGAAVSPSLMASPAATPPASPSATTSLGAAATNAIDLDAMALLWQSGEEAGFSEWVADVGIAPSGDIVYVVDFDSSIKMFSPDGEFIGVWGEPGTGPGQFQFLTPDAGAGSIGFDADGNIYVFDGMNNRIQKFDVNRNYISEWGEFGTGEGQFNMVVGVVDADSQRIYASDFFNNRIQVFDLDGHLIDVWGEFGTGLGQMNGPVPVVLAGDGTLYLTSQFNPSIQHFTVDGEYLGTLVEADDLGGFSPAMALDSAGNLWAAPYDTGRVQIFAPDRTLLGAFNEVPGAGSLQATVSLAFDGAGNLYILSDGNGLVKVAFGEAGSATPAATPMS